MENETVGDGLRRLSPGAPSVLEAGAAAFGIVLGDGQLAQFAAYTELLLEWNQRLNLTAVDDPEEIQVRHFLDSLSCVAVTGNLNGQRLVDVGSGAGFPGLPLKILYPALQLTLLESVAKKGRFLETAATELGIDDISILVGRAETIGHVPTERGRYDWAVARAVAPLNVLAEYLLPLCRPGGHMLAMKGPKAIEESSAAERAVKTLGGDSPVLHPVRLPGRPESRYLVVVEKVAATPGRYPRREGMPKKRPLP